MKYRDEEQTIETVAAMRFTPEYIERHVDAVGRIIADTLKVSLPELPNDLTPRGRVQFLAKITITVLPEFGMPMEGEYARIAGEFEIPIVDEKVQK